MEDRNQHIDQYFREQLGGYTEQPTPDVWAALEQRLDEKPRKKRVLWVWFTLFFMAAIGGTAYFTYHYNSAYVVPALSKPTTSSHEPVIKQSTAGIAGQPAKTLLPATQPKEKNEYQPRKQPNKTTVQHPQPVNPVYAASRIISATSGDQPETTNAINETVAIETTEPQPIEPVKAEIKKPEMERDILQLLPTAGVYVPVAKIDEEEFQALSPKSGSTKADVAATPVATNSTAEQISVADSIKPVSKTDSTPSIDSQAKTPTDIPPVSSKAENDRTKRFAAGLKSGYEFGTKPYHANSFVLSPYVQYNFNKRFGLLLQPAFKYSHSTAAVLSHGSYTQTIDSLKEMLPPITPNMGSRIPTGNDEYMAYQKTYDSIFIRNELKDIRYWNLDLPLMLSYKVHKNFSVYAGPAFHFTKVPKVVTSKQKYSGMVLNDTLRMERKPMSVEFDTLGINEVFPQKGFDISQYNGSAFDNPTINPFKMGVTFGLSYTFMQRFHFDILYRQTLSQMNYIANDKVREILKQPYIRVTLGFDLLK